MQAAISAGNSSCTYMVCCHRRKSHGHHETSITQESRPKIPERCDRWMIGILDHQVLDKIKETPINQNPLMLTQSNRSRQLLQNGTPRTGHVWNQKWQWMSLTAFTKHMKTVKFSVIIVTCLFSRSLRVWHTKVMRVNQIREQGNMLSSSFKVVFHSYSFL